jgi:hypothetical protein
MPMHRKKENHLISICKFGKKSEHKNIKTPTNIKNSSTMNTKTGREQAERGGKLYGYC